MSPFARAHSRTSTASCSGASARMTGELNGEPISSSGLATNVTAADARRPPASAAIAWSPASSPPFMSVTPGPIALPPSDRYGRSAAVPGSKTVSMWPISSSRGPSPSSRPMTRSPSRGPSPRARGVCARRSPPGLAERIGHEVGDAVDAVGRVRAAVDVHERSSSPRYCGRRDSTMRRSAEGSGMAVNILTPMPQRAGRRGRGVELVELRVLDGPNRFFTRPAVKLEFAGTEPGDAAHVAEAAGARSGGCQSSSAFREPRLATTRVGRRAPVGDRLSVAPPDDLAVDRRIGLAAWPSDGRRRSGRSPGCGRPRSGRSRTCRGRASRSLPSPARTGRARRPG